MAKKKSEKLTFLHVIGYGCGDCGGSCGEGECGEGCDCNGCH